MKPSPNKSLKDLFMSECQQPTLPESVTSKGILVGWSKEAEHHRRPIGFSFGDQPGQIAPNIIDPILLEDEGHLITIAPTGAGKGVSAIIPALLRYEGPVIVIDPKGENVAVTARARREMGQRVIVIDPMDITKFESDTFNPLDGLDPYGHGVTDFIGTIVRSLMKPGENHHSPFWTSQGRRTLKACITQVLLQYGSDANLTHVRDLLAQLMDMEKIDKLGLRYSDHPEVRTCFQGVPTASETWSGILSHAIDSLNFMSGPEIHQTLSTSSFSLDEVTKGEPISIYLVLPPAMLESYAPLLRLWVSSLMFAIGRRRRRPDQATLFLLDEAAQLGELPQLRQAMTLMRGYGLRTWSFWQDLSQLTNLYPRDWPTMVNNAKVFQSFGANNVMAAKGLSEIVGFTHMDGRRLIDLRSDEMILQIAGDDAVIARKPDYLNDPIFKGLYDSNPLYASEGTIMPNENGRHEYYDRMKSIQRDTPLIKIDLEDAERARKVKERQKKAKEISDSLRDLVEKNDKSEEKY